MPSKVSIATIVPLRENLPKFLMLMECLHSPVHDLYHERGAQFDVGEMLLGSRGETRGLFCNVFGCPTVCRLTLLIQHPTEVPEQVARFFRVFFSVIKRPTGSFRHISVFHHYA